MPTLQEKSLYQSLTQLGERAFPWGFQFKEKGGNEETHVHISGKGSLKGRDLTIKL